MIRGLVASIVISMAGVAYEPTLPSEVPPSPGAHHAQRAELNNSSTSSVIAIAANGAPVARIGMMRVEKQLTVALIYRYVPLSIAGFFSVWGVFAFASRNDGEVHRR